MHTQTAYTQREKGYMNLRLCMDTSRKQSNATVQAVVHTTMRNPQNMLQAPSMIIDISMVVVSSDAPIDFEPPQLPSECISAVASSGLDALLLCARTQRLPQYTVWSCMCSTVQKLLQAQPPFADTARQLWDLLSALMSTPQVCTYVYVHTVEHWSVSKHAVRARRSRHAVQAAKLELWYTYMLVCI